LFSRLTLSAAISSLSARKYPIGTTDEPLFVLGCDMINSFFNG
jgi:hypothetical protein